MNYTEIPVMSKNELIELITLNYNSPDKSLIEKADELRRFNYNTKVFLRGLIELTNYCKNNCFYCGIQSSNKNITRYRLQKDDVLNCCTNGYELGFRTFVLQGGEDSFYTDDIMTDLIYAVRNKYPDCAITLSLGEKSKETYKKYFDAGANRYLLRHETATESHYKKLHPSNLSLSTRKKCLYSLKEIGFQTGAGFMVGSPFQTIENLADDLLFIKDLQPEMVGIGPFIAQKDTCYKDEPSGTLNATLAILAITRIMLPKCLLPSTTALASISDVGRELGLKAGCNVVMPNLSPSETRKNYALYDNKASSGSEAAEGLRVLKDKIENAGYTVDFGRGDHVDNLWD